ncbi:hypothetical protein ABZ442_29705 [Streptomyces triculaminicus]|uniref:hypothetical protein n=1 Tax=Streptomyces triculaminicus TaxID=2816232 RepID=UPI0033DB59A6
MPQPAEYRVGMAVGFVALLIGVNLRGVGESGRAFAPPTYLFITGVLITVVTGLIRWAVGHTPVPESVGFGITPEPADAGPAGFALVALFTSRREVSCSRVWEAPGSAVG